MFIHLSSRCCYARRFWLFILVFKSFWVVQCESKSTHSIFFLFFNPPVDHGPTTYYYIPRIFLFDLRIFSISVYSRNSELSVSSNCFISFDFVFTTIFSDLWLWRNGEIGIRRYGRADLWNGMVLMSNRVAKEFDCSVGSDSAADWYERIAFDELFAFYI